MKNFTLNFHNTDIIPVQPTVGGGNVHKPEEFNEFQASFDAHGDQAERMDVFLTIAESQGVSIDGAWHYANGYLSAPSLVFTGSTPQLRLYVKMLFYAYNFPERQFPPRSKEELEDGLDLLRARARAHRGS